MVRAAILLFSVFALLSCGRPPLTTTATLVLTGSVSPSHTLGLVPYWVPPSPQSLWMSNLSAGTGGGNPASVVATFYRLYASAFDDCSSPLIVHDYGSLGSDKDLTFNPLLFAGSPPGGPYNCVAIEMDDFVKFRPEPAAVANWQGVCADIATQYSSDLYRADDTLAWQDIEGQLIMPRGTQRAPTVDRIVLFASISPARVMAGPMAAAESQISLLLRPLDAPTGLVFFADFKGKVSGTDALCHLENPVFGFR